MRKIALVLSLLLLSLPIYARNPSRLAKMTAGNSAAITITPVPAGLPEHLLAQLKARAAAHRVASRAGVHASAITDTVSARALVITAAGSIEGAGGLFFHSDVTLANYRDTPQQVVAGFWAQGTTNKLDLASYKSFTLPAQQYVTIQNFVVTLGQNNALGAIILIPYTGTDFDENSAIDAFSRIYTKQPGSTGTVSQPFDAVDPDWFSAQLIDEAVALGLRHDADYRTNFGIVNVDAADHVFKVTFIGEKMQTSTTVTVKAYGMIQQGIPPGDYGALQVLYQVTDAGSNFVTWVGYASSTDNITGDGWVSLASGDLSPDELSSIGY